jgi:hypothetical protein
MNTNIVSLLRIIFIATSSGSSMPAFRSLARTTVEKTPFPWAATISYRPSSTSPNRWPTYQNNNIKNQNNYLKSKNNILIYHIHEFSRSINACDKLKTSLYFLSLPLKWCKVKSHPPEQEHMFWWKKRKINTFKMD